MPSGPRWKGGAALRPARARRRGTGRARAEVLRAGVSLVEMMLALAVMAALLAAVAVAMQGVFQAYNENQKIAEVTQVARAVLHRMMKEVRTADGVDSASQRISIIPPANGAGVTAIEYELVSGTLYYRQTVGGVETSEPLIAADGDVQVTAFNVSRQTDLDGEGVSYTKTLTAELALTVGENPFQVTASVCPRRNISF